MPESYTDRFFEELHKAEFERKDQHSETDGFLLTSLSLLGGVGIYFAKLLPDAWKAVV